MGFGAAARDSAVAAGPLADYAVHGITNSWLSGSAAGLIGALVTAVLGLGVAALVVRRRTCPAPAAHEPTAG